MDSYRSPFAERYASVDMQHLFSPQYKHSTWRRLWLALAQAQHELGLPITQAQIDQMAAHLDDIDWQKVADYESQMQHDVMAHIHAYADQCPLARPIIHLGATSCYVTDNGDLIQMHAGMRLLLPKLALVIQQLSDFARQHAHLACLAYTHFQAAQPTTVGKRTCLWIQDLLLDLQELHRQIQGLRFLGIKGATGTQASFLELFAHDHTKVAALEHLIAKKMGFTHLFHIAGQTYTRKQDVHVLNALAGIAISAHKMGTDLRLLAHLKEVEEPFSQDQVGSSAMPYKRNPILSERLCALARFLMSLAENPAYTAATQWLERSLDDSANRRLCIAEAFLCCDALLEILLKLSRGLVINKGIITQHLAAEMPFLATENILMRGVAKGGDRQQLHAKIRTHCLAASQRIKEQGLPNDLLERLAADPALALSQQELAQLTDPTHFIGNAAAQVAEFWHQEIQPALANANR